MTNEKTEFSIRTMDENGKCVLFLNGGHNKIVSMLVNLMTQNEKAKKIILETNEIYTTIKNPKNDKR